MPGLGSPRRWWYFPSRLALLLGMGALSAGGAHADAATVPDAALASGPGDVLVCAVAGHIYLSQAGGAFSELKLGDTVEARRLKELLAAHGAAGVRLPPTILAGAGGSGIHWPAGGQRTVLDGTTPAGGAYSRQADNPGAAPPSQQPPAPHLKKLRRAGDKE